MTSSPKMRNYVIGLILSHNDVNYVILNRKKKIFRAILCSQDQLFKVKVKSDSSRPVMVTNFRPRNPNVAKLIRDNWNIIQNMDGSNPNDTKGRRGLELFYIWAFPTLRPAGINIFV